MPGASSSVPVALFAVMAALLFLPFVLLAAAPFLLLKMAFRRRASSGMRRAHYSIS